MGKQDRVSFRAKLPHALLFYANFPGGVGDRFDRRKGVTLLEGFLSDGCGHDVSSEMIYEIF
jgi:hypothetical protein